MKDKTLKLSIELVPSTVWESSLYKLMPREVWNSIRDDFIKENGRKCQVCGEIEGKMNLHEVWKYDDAKHIQKLEGFILLCGMCHHVEKNELADRNKQEYGVKYRYWKSDEATLEGKYSKEFLNKLQESERKHFTSEKRIIEFRDKKRESNP